MRRRRAIAVAVEHVLDDELADSRGGVCHKLERAVWGRRQLGIMGAGKEAALVHGLACLRADAVHEAVAVDRRVDHVALLAEAVALDQDGHVALAARRRRGWGRRRRGPGAATAVGTAPSVAEAAAESVVGSWEAGQGGAAAMAASGAASDPRWRSTSRSSVAAPAACTGAHVHVALHVAVLEGARVAVEAHRARRRRLARRGVRRREPTSHLAAAGPVSRGNVGHAVARGASKAIPRGLVQRSGVGHWLRRMRVAHIRATVVNLRFANVAPIFRECAGRVQRLRAARVAAVAAAQETAAVVRTATAAAALEPSRHSQRGLGWCQPRNRNAQRGSWAGAATAAAMEVAATEAVGGLMGRVARR
eukprot:scaffold20803_cov59-Phaeocystis_antarctica.AAC.1